MTLCCWQNARGICRVVNEFCSACKRKKLKVNAGKGKVMVFERRGDAVIDFNTAYRIRLPAVVRCRIMLGSEKMEVSEFKYLRTVLCKHGGMEGEIRVTDERWVGGAHHPPPNVCRFT